MILRELSQFISNCSTSAAVWPVDLPVNGWRAKCFSARTYVSYFRVEHHMRRLHYIGPRPRERQGPFDFEIRSPESFFTLEQYLGIEGSFDWHDFAHTLYLDLDTSISTRCAAHESAGKSTCKKRMCTVASGLWFSFLSDRPWSKDET